MICSSKFSLPVILFHLLQTSKVWRDFHPILEMGKTQGDFGELARVSMAG